MLKNLLPFLLVVFSLQLIGQSDLAIGEWKSYLPYQKADWVTQSKDKIIYSTEWSILTIDKEDLSHKFLSKVEGLSDVGISRCIYDNNNEQLIIAYTNSNIDIVVGDEIYNLSDIKDNSSILGDRQIYDLHISQDNYCYMATSFGVVQLDLISREFGATTFTGQRVNSITSKENKIYAATDEGLYVVDASSSNIADFGAWQLLDNHGIPLLFPTSEVENYRGDIYVAVDGSDLYKETNGVFEKIYSDPNEELDVKFLSAEGKSLMVGLKAPDKDKARTLFIDENGGQTLGGANCIFRLIYGIEDEQSRVWYADGFHRIRYTDTYTSGCNMISYDSPYSHTAGEITIADDVVYVTCGGVTDAYGFRYNRDGFYMLENNSWTNYNERIYEPLAGEDIYNLFRVAVHPETKKAYFGSFWDGIVEFDKENETVELYSKENSSLQGVTGFEEVTLISGLAFDDNNNLWISNFNAARPLSVYTNEGVWHNFSIPAYRQLAEIAIDNNGYKWIVVIGNNGGVLVYDDNGTIEYPDDDRTRFISLNNSALSTNLVASVAVDLDGDVWVGTASGPVVFECGSAVFESDCRGSHRKVEQDSIVAFLLETEDIRTIEIDGANRKWFGTKNGIFVQSPDGEQQVLQLDQDNSLLFDNSINDLAFSPRTGEMFIATDKGIQSYKTTSTAAKNTHASTVFAYPNPVRPDYVGPIAIKGLARDANVKITDLNGKLVYETTALGGQAIWDGKDYTGRKARTGVYLVFSTGTASFDTPDSYVTKIMVLD